jgi:hypothetical protein
LRRIYDQVTNELLVYAVDEQSVFRLVRRRIVPSIGLTQLALPDGTVLVQDATTIRSYLPDNAERVVFRRSEGIFVTPAAPYGAQLLAGPLMPETQP